MEAYRQSIPGLGPAIERGTSRVPDDGYFYVLLAGELQGRHRTLKQAQLQYKRLIVAEGWKPEPAESGRTDPAREGVERYMDSLEDYWNEAQSHRRRGGKTMYRS